MVKEKEMEKEMYVAPSIEVIQFEAGSVLCGSNVDPKEMINGENDRWGGSWGDDF